MALNRRGPVEMTRLAHDIGVSETDFRVLASRWPGASDLLSQRMQLMKSRCQRNHTSRAGGRPGSAKSVQSVRKPAKVQAGSRERYILSGVAELLSE